MKGGAIHISGSQSGAFLSGNCIFHDNRVGATANSSDGQSGVVARGSDCGRGGGGISVEDSADLYLHDAISTGDTAITSDGDGGFSLPALRVKSCCKMSVSTGFQRNRRWRRAQCVHHAIALDRVEIRNCRAGARGGGGILLYGEATADLIRGCILSSNTASTEFGGNVRLASSRLNVHSDSYTLEWPASAPVFPHVMSLNSHHDAPANRRPTTIDHGVARSGGGIFCMASAFPSRGVHLGLGTIVSHSFANGDNQDEGGGGISTILCDVRLHGASLLHNSASLEAVAEERCVLGHGQGSRSQETPILLVTWRWLARAELFSVTSVMVWIFLMGQSSKTTWQTDMAAPLAF